MSINLSNEINTHVQALKLRAMRAEILANNLANSDTPGFYARDIDFKQELSKALSATEHQTPVLHAPLKYRTPMQPSLDGNTVDSQQEYVRFADNAMRYQASLKLLSQQLHTLKVAIGGQI